MRCFISIELPEEVKKELQKLQEDIRSSNIKASFSKGFHLTLKYLGDLTPEKVEHVKKRLSSCKFKKFEVTLDDFGVFPNEKHIKVIWVGIKPEEDVVKLQKEIDEAMQKDFKKEKQFKAHLTLARIKHVKDKENFLQFLKNIEIKKINFSVNEFKLMRSTLTAEGPVYDELFVYKQ
ncbi:RNA 2',3'-cyclic phosphodiesterase [Candidatus Woesearchaeota archaeon]|nr:RNA 2',3'-cyclic phosphodiesterase [Candidatus Woesearchaeota archaeon]|tara:strand:+ start:11845 stop:12375 length:531 start_codon:yes stop_codon:yes gene_type:complete